MIDIHTHILPSVDDGASHLEQAIEIIKRGMQEGITAFVLTPHIREDADWKMLDYIKETFILLKNECIQRGICTRLILGAEVSLHPDLPERLKKINLTINGGRYILVELPFSQLPIYAENVIFQLMVEGFVPIIAHLERYAYLKGNDRVLRHWKDNGVMFQMNAGSLSGKYGLRTKLFAKRLLAADFVHFLGSDAHSVDDMGYFRKGFDVITRMGCHTVMETMKSFCETHLTI